MISIEGNFDDIEVHNLLTKHFIELKSVSLEGSSHVLDIEGLKDPTIKFWSLWEKDQLFGCGALKFLSKEHGEFKSIRVSDNFRKKGNGIKISGFKLCLPFADYKKDQNSCYMSLLISN
jgi:putative acetyltransferase